MFNWKHICGEENHLFEPRYNYKDGDGGDLKFTYATPESIAKILEIAKRGDYVYDICIYCGKTVSIR